MKTFKYIYIIAVLLVLVKCDEPRKGITDIIQPVILDEGKTTTVVLSDLFYADDYHLVFLPNKNFKIVNDTVNNLIMITPSKEFAGFDLLSFQFKGKEYEIPVKLKKKKKYLFKYKPAGNPQTVNLFGQFNGWDRKNLPMKDENGDGVYEIRIPLDPGRYEYKFYVDGKELVDPENPVKVSNGMGDFNSVIVINKTAGNKQYLHLLDYKVDGDMISYNFYYETLAMDLTTAEDVIALLNNSEVSANHISLDGTKIILKFNKSELTGKNVLRVVVSKRNTFTNFQTIKLNDGIPFAGKEKDDWQNAIIYSIMIDRFYDGDTTNSIPVKQKGLSYKANYQGGDLQGLLDKLNDGYFDSLGVNTLWISPVVNNTNKAYREFPPPHRYFTGYHGYWPVSTTEVEEHFGNMELTKKLVDTAHRHGIKVLLDYVAHHVHEDNPLWKEHRDWFGVLDLPDGRKNLRLFDEYRLTTWFEPYLPSFDYVHSNEALEYMTDNAVWWIKQTGVDGFRHDAVKHVPNKFWRTLTRKLREQIEIPQHKSVYQIGETFGSMKLISSYVNPGQLSAQFNFTLFDVAIPVFLYEDNSFELIDYQMQKSFDVYGMHNLMGNIMDSHDKIRFMAYADGDVELNSNKAAEIGWNNPPKVDHPSSYKKLKLYLSYLLTIPGVPVIYYGDEIGMTGAADPDNRRMMKFGDELDNYQKQTLKDVSELIHLRKNHTALNDGDFYTLLANDACYAFIRSDFNERILVILNKSDKEQKLDLQIPSYYKITGTVNLQTKERERIDKNILSVKLQPTSWKILQLQ